MNDLDEAFLYPVDRSLATAGSKMLDRISVRDYIVNVEIGAFRVEHGVKQKIKVNVVLEILPNNAFETDNVDRVISYDTLVESIDYQFYSERVNLLETVAERIAQSCLEDARAVRVFVRIEKLERITGGLGVEIVRENIQGLRKLQNPTYKKSKIKPSLKILNVPKEYVNQRLVNELINKINRLEAKYILILSQDSESKAFQFENLNDFYASLLEMDQSAWLFAKYSEKFLVVDSRTELDWAIKNDRIPIWAPYNMYSKVVNPPKKYFSAPLYLGCWLAFETEASELLDFSSIPPSENEILDFNSFQIPIKFINLQTFLIDGA